MQFLIHEDNQLTFQMPTEKTLSDLVGQVIGVIFLCRSSTLLDLDCSASNHCSASGLSSKCTCTSEEVEKLLR
jgi:hypothetical protein